MSLQLSNSHLNLGDLVYIDVCMYAHVSLYILKENKNSFQKMQLQIEENASIRGIISLANIHVDRKILFINNNREME